MKFSAGNTDRAHTIYQFTFCYLAILRAVEEVVETEIVSSQTHTKRNLNSLTLRRLGTFLLGLFLFECLVTHSVGRPPGAVSVGMATTPDNALRSIHGDLQKTDKSASVVQRACVFYTEWH